MIRILGLDPGETTGLALLKFGPGLPSRLILDCYEQVELPITQTKLTRGFNWAEVQPEVYCMVADYRPTVIVIEDFRLYHSKAMAQVGRHMLTAELIGAICYAAQERGIDVVRVSATKKGRWPEARLSRKFPDYFNAPAPHARDAVILGLIYAEAKEWI